jgi:hypothetical protein
MVLYRFDLTFSYWIFAWYLLFIARLIKSSPKLALILALLTNIYDLLVFFIEHVRWDLILTFVFLMVAIKVIPLWTLRNMPIDFRREFPRFCFVFLVYVTWLHLNGYNLDTESRELKTLFSKGQTSAVWTPATQLIRDIRRKTEAKP